MRENPENAAKKPKTGELFRCLPARRRLLVGALLAGVLFPGIALAVVPVTSSVQGVLSAGGGGAAADGNYALTFSLYDSQLGGTAVWQEGPVTVAVAAGRFVHALGTAKPLDAKLLGGLKQAWLGVKIGGDPELPRQPLRSVVFALAAQQAASLSCSGCVTAAHLAPGVVDPNKPAKDLQCSGCVSMSELKFDGDIDLGSHVIKAAKGVFGTVNAKDVIATSFLGDGSQLTGIKTPAGSCTKPGEVVKGIKADGSLDCVAAMDPSALPKDGLDEISNGLLSNQFQDKIASTNTPVDIKDNNPVGVSDELTFPDIGIAQKLTVHLDLTNSNISKLTVKLFDPNNKEHLLYGGGGTGKSITTSYPTPTKTLSGDLTAWVGNNPKGKWRLVVTDSLFFNNGVDGQIKSWSVEIQTLSNKKVAATGIMRMPGGSVLQTAEKAPAVCNKDHTGYIYYNPKSRSLQVCNGTKFDIVETLPGGVGSQGEPGLSCQDILTKDKDAKDGVYWLDPDGAGGAGGKFKVWCDMTTAGGGWVLVMQVQAGHTTKFGYGSSQWTSNTTTASVPPQALSSVDAKYATFNSFKTNDGQLLLRDKTSKNHTVLDVPSMKGNTLLNRFQSLGGKTAYNTNQGATLKFVSGKASPQELMGFAAPTTMCAQNAVKWRMNMLSSHSGVRIGNDVASNGQTTNNPSSWKCYDNKTNLSYSGVGGTLESNRTWQDGYGSESLNRWRDSGGRGQGSQKGVELYVR